jgi:type I restriction enzyme M protein
VQAFGEAFDYLMHSKKLTDILQLLKKTFYGKEKKSLAYIIGTMNMILHGVEAPNIIYILIAENISDLQGKDRYDIIPYEPTFEEKNALRCSKTSL